MAFSGARSREILPRLGSGAGGPAGLDWVRSERLGGSDGRLPVWFEGPCTPSAPLSCPQVRVSITGLFRVSLASESSRHQTLEQTPSPGMGRLRKEARDPAFLPCGPGQPPHSPSLP